MIKKERDEFEHFSAMIKACSTASLKTFFDCETGDQIEVPYNVDELKRVGSKIVNVTSNKKLIERLIFSTESPIIRSSLINAVTLKYSVGAHEMVKKAINQETSFNVIENFVNLIENSKNSENIDAYKNILSELQEKISEKLGVVKEEAYFLYFANGQLINDYFIETKVDINNF